MIVTGGGNVGIIAVIATDEGNAEHATGWDDPDNVKAIGTGEGTADNVTVTETGGGVSGIGAMTVIWVGESGNGDGAVAAFDGEAASKRTIASPVAHTMPPPRLPRDPKNKNRSRVIMIVLPNRGTSFTLVPPTHCDLREEKHTSYRGDVCEGDTQ
ncbi:MAG: hypothetical protein P4M13_02610 [Alphaproteobacteria bacterium]|nr:hypothetical protein [Alphaproteobacteria bacterium]